MTHFICFSLDATKLNILLSYREQFKEEDEEADRGNDGKTTSKSGLALNGTSCYGKLRTVRSGGSWLQNLQWCPNGQPDYGIDKIRSAISKRLI